MAPDGEGSESASLAHNSKAVGSGSRTVVSFDLGADGTGETLSEAGFT